MIDHDIEICDESRVHDDTLQLVSASMPDEELLYDLADLFKTFGDTTRIKILYALMDEAMCVCDLSALLGVTQPAVSHQLKILKQAKLISCRREGKSVLYSLSDDHVHTMIAQALAHVRE